MWLTQREVVSFFLTCEILDSLRDERNRDVFRLTANLSKDLSKFF